MKLTPAQARILATFRANPRRKSHPDYWQPSDTRPIKALLDAGLIEYELGCYRDDYYVLTPKGRESMRVLP